MSATGQTLGHAAASFTFVIVAGLSVGAVTWSQDDNAERAATLERMDAQARSIHDLTSDFVEEKFTALLKEPIVSRGRVFVSGTRTRWSTTSPHESTLYTDESRVAVYFPARRTMEVYPLDQRLRSLVVSPVPRLDTLERHFHMRVVPRADVQHDDDEKSKPLLVLRLMPKDDALADLIAEIRVSVDANTGLAARVEMLDPDGERTVLTFSNTRTNVGLTDADVAWDVPSDTKIVEPLGPVTGDSTSPRTK